MGNIIRVDQKVCKVLSHEIGGTGKFGKTVHAKLKSLEDGNVLERSFKGEDRFEEITPEQVKMQYLYREGDRFVFMNLDTYEQFLVSARTVGKQEVFLKENSEINVLFIDEKPVSIDFPKVVELKVKSAPPPLKGGSDTTYKEVELENGLKILAPQFVKEGESVRVHTEDFSYVDRVTTRSLKPEQE